MKFWNWLKSLFKKKRVEAPKKELEERPSNDERGKKVLRYPLAIQDKGGEMRSRGKYRKGYPEGAIVHFTAGASASSSLSWGIKKGYMFFVIDRNGDVYQNFDLDEWGYHAGTSAWKGLPGSVSNELVGIEIDNSGRLRKKSGRWESWFGRVIPVANTRTIKKARYKGEVPATYEKYTPEQEKSLIALLKWLENNNPEVFKFDLVLGHDEVRTAAGKYGSKNDPGGALSMSMDKLREKLKKG